jgi:hypothetical protein
MSKSEELIPPVHPGEVLREDFMKPLGLTVNRLALELRVALNQLITLALAEKVSAMRTEEYFEERARRAEPARVSRILARVGNQGGFLLSLRTRMTSS